MTANPPTSPAISADMNEPYFLIVDARRESERSDSHGV